MIPVWPTEPTTTQSARTPPLCSSSSSYASRPDLHSFPTRRSSDLFSPLRVFENVILHTAAQQTETETALFHLAVSLLARPRSEEHTSELQSRLHLVCRLLLEKKKDGTP